MNSDVKGISFTGSQIDSRLTPLRYSSGRDLDNGVRRKCSKFLKEQPFERACSANERMQAAALALFQPEVSTQNAAFIDDKMLCEITGKIISDPRYLTEISGKTVGRLASLQDMLIQILLEKNARSTWTDQFLREIHRVKQLDCENLVSYFETLKNKAFRTMRYCLGAKKSERKEYLATMRYWLTHAEKMLTDLFKERIQATKELSFLPYRKMTWIEPENSKNPICSITIREISRCFIVGKEILFAQITVNGEELLPFVCQEESVESYQQKFFEMLLLKIYKVPATENVAAQSRLLVQAKNIETPRSQELSCQIPAADILRLATLSAWSQAQECLMQNFSGVFTNPIWTRASQGIICAIKVQDNGSFSVTQTKHYTTYRKLTPNQSDSTTVDRQADLCDYTFCWTLSPVVDKGSRIWRGVFEIPDCRINGSHASEDEKWQILQTLAAGVRNVRTSQESIFPKTLNLSGKKL